MSLNNLWFSIQQPRVLGAVAFFVCAALLAIAFYMEYVLFLEPCPLCMAQRIAFAGFGLTGLAMALVPATATRTKVFASFGVLFSLGGLALAARQLWLQSLPADQIPDCAPGLYYMIESLPFTQVLQSMLLGTGDCASVQWQFLGLSIPGWTAVAFSVMAIKAAALPWFARSS